MRILSSMGKRSFGAGFALVPFVLAMACGSKAGTSPAPSLAATDLDQTLAGKPPADVQAAAQAIAAALTPDEQQHLEEIDWASARGSTLLADLVFLKALRAVGNVGPASLVTNSAPVPADSLRPANLTILDEYTCDADCATCQQALDKAINDELARIRSRLGGQVLTCVLIALETGAGGAVCGAIVLFLHRQEIYWLIKLAACAALGGGGTIVQSFSDVSDVNASCVPTCTKLAGTTQSWSPVTSVPAGYPSQVHEAPGATATVSYVVVMPERFEADVTLPAADCTSDGGTTSWAVPEQTDRVVIMSGPVNKFDTFSTNLCLLSAIGGDLSAGFFKYDTQGPSSLMFEHTRNFPVQCGGPVVEKVSLSR